MDPDSSGNFSSSAIYKTSILSVAFSSFYFYRTDNHSFHFKPAAENTDTVKIQLVVKAVLPVKKTIYLTFDDGPNKGTKTVMQIIKQENIPVTLFVIGEHVYGSKYQSELYDSISHNGLFEIANHSFTHAFSNRYDQFYNNPDSAVKDFIRCADSLKLHSNIIRTPGRNIWRTDSIHSTDLRNSIATADSLQMRGFKAMGWDLEWHYNQQRRLVQTYQEILDEVDSAFAKNKTKTYNHLVLLAHDHAYTNSLDSASLHQFIINIKRNDNYQFQIASKYPGMQPL